MCVYTNRRINMDKRKKEAYTSDDMAMRIPALSDIVFKFIFGSEESVDILKDFINAVLVDAGFPEIESVSIVNPVNVKTYLDEKITVIDTRAKDQSGNMYNVEVQIRSQADYQDRSLYYWAKTYSEQLKTGHEYGVLHKVISISILDFMLFPEDVPFHSCFMLRENGKPHYVLTEDCTLHYLEVPKLNDEPKTDVEKWLYLLKHADEEDETMKVLLDDDSMFQAAKKRYDYFIADEKARQAYLAREMFLHDQATNIAEARRKGLAEGREEGREEGKEEGREEGKREQTIAIARKMKEVHGSIDQISKATGLHTEEIEAL